jgi:MerR family transcriptional regulator, copper efflux regulator
MLRLSLLPMDALTINEAARTTGWSPRMLRYIERAGLLVLRRSAGGYRLYGPEQLQRLRTLHELLDRFGFGLAELGFALRLRTEPALSRAVEDWFETEPARPVGVEADDWLRWEQEKHEALIAAATITYQLETA